MAEKTLAFKIDIEGVSNESQELAKLEVNLKNIKKERDELMKQATRPGHIASTAEVQKIAAYDKEIRKMSSSQRQLKKDVDSAGDSLNRMRSRLAQMKAAAAAGSSEVNAKMTPAIKKLTDEISKAEQAQGTFTRNVGNYSSAFVGLGDKIKGAFTQLMAGGAVIGMATAAFVKLKDAIMSTTTAIDNMNVVAGVSKQLFYDIAVNGQINIDNLKTAAEAAQTFNKLRTEQYEIDFRLSHIQREINSLMLEQSDVEMSAAESGKILNKVRELDAEQTEIETDALKKKLKATLALMEKRQDDENLQREAWSLARQIEEAYARSDQQMRRVESRRTAAIKKEKQEEEDVLKRRHDEIEAWNKKNALLEKGTAEYAKMQDEIAKVIIAEAELAARRKFSQKEIEESLKPMFQDVDDFETYIKKFSSIDEEWIRGMNEGREKFRENEEKRRQIKIQQDEEDYEKVRDREENIRDFKLAALYGIEMGAAAVFESKKSRLNAEMTAELSNENLTYEQRMAIQKKYAKQQQRIDTQQAIINGALAIGNALATTKPFIPAGLIAAALATIQTGTQIASIKAQKFATGGRIQGGLQIHPDKSKDNTLIYVKQNETVLNESQVARLGGSGAMRKARVPGYADGGYVGQQAPEIPAMGFDYTQLARLMNSIEVKLDINKVNSAQKEIQLITEPQPL